MNNEVMGLIDQVIGKPCTRKEVGRMRSLSLGFGAEVRSAIQLNEAVYREWEIGTYSSAWRIIRDGVVLCGSQDAVGSVEERNVALARIELGKFASLRQPTLLDVSVEFDNGFSVDFLATTSDEDEIFHMFCPGALYLEFSVRGGWKTGPADKPWT